MKFLKILTISTLLIATSCDLDIQPENKSTIDNLLLEDGGIATATNGSYALLKDVLGFRGAGPNSNNDYARHLYQMSEFAADNVMYTQFSPDPLYLVFTREHIQDQENSAYFWFIAYRIMLGTNLIINNAAEGIDAQTDQLIGENYFLRAMASFDLLRFFAKPYGQGRDNLGIVLRTSASEPTLEARATVGECYDQVVADLLKAEELMTEDNGRGVEYASKRAAQALLSRVYLYMEEYDKVIEYADKVEASGIRLATNAEYLDNFANTPSSAESIFVIKFTLQDHRGKNGSIGSMYYDDGNNNGWGEVFASESFRDLLGEYPDDVRNGLIVSPGGTKNGYPIHYITKFSGQDGVVNLCSPQYLRYSEVVLNRAEANAHLGNDAEAISEVNDIRMRAGLSGAALYDETDLGGKTVLDVVLEERRLELAYEGHRGFDLVRNERNLVRDYEGIHLENGDTRLSIPYDDDRWIYYIPLQEMSINSLVKQNP